MATQVANKRNRDISAEHTRVTGRNSRVNEEFERTGQMSGDFRNKNDMKAYTGKSKKTGLTQQTLGNRDQKRADIRSAFGLSNG